MIPPEAIDWSMANKLHAAVDICIDNPRKLATWAALQRTKNHFRDSAMKYVIQQWNMTYQTLTVTDRFRQAAHAVFGGRNKDIRSDPNLSFN